MKTIGLLGGMSWESSALYYRWINEILREKLGGYHSGKIILYSLDFHEIEILQKNGAWNQAGGVLANYAKKIESAGADFLLICTNTMHKVSREVEEAIDIPVLHIADATAEVIRSSGMRKVGLLGTRFTMEEDFYAGRLKDRYGLEVLIPDEADRKLINQIIFEELVLGIIKEDSRKVFLRIMTNLVKQGALGIIEGCTEIVMLVQQHHTDIPLFDTTAIHAQKAVDYALE